MKGGYADYMRDHDIPPGGWNEPDDDDDGEPRDERRAMDRDCQIGGMDDE